MAGSRLGATDISVEGFDPMHQPLGDQEFQRPIDRQRRGAASGGAHFVAQIVKNIVGPARAMAGPNQFQDSPTQRCQTSPPRGTQSLGLRQRPGHAVGMIVRTRLPLSFCYQLRHRALSGTLSSPSLQQLKPVRMLCRIRFWSSGWPCRGFVIRVGFHVCFRLGVVVCVGESVGLWASAGFRGINAFRIYRNAGSGAVGCRWSRRVR